jgi:hypothetical protein
LDPRVQVEHNNAIAARVQDKRIEGLRLPKSFVRPTLLGPVSHNLDEAFDGAFRLSQRHKFAARPELGIVAAPMPAFIGATAFRQRKRHLGLWGATPPIVFGEDDIGRVADNLGHRPSENAACPFIPTRHNAIEIQRDDGVIGRACEEGFQKALAEGCRRRVRSLAHGSAGESNAVGGGVFTVTAF